MGKEELKKQKEKYDSDPKVREKKKEMYKKGKEEDILFVENKRKSRKEKQEKLEKEKAEKILFKRKHHEEKDDPFVIQCLFCSSSYEYTSILKHVGNSKLCKAFYGPRFEKMKKRHRRIRMR